MRPTAGCPGVKERAGGCRPWEPLRQTRATRSSGGLGRTGLDEQLREPSPVAVVGPAESVDREVVRLHRGQHEDPVTELVGSRDRTGLAAHGGGEHGDAGQPLVVHLLQDRVHVGHASGGPQREGDRRDAGGGAGGPRRVGGERVLCRSGGFDDGDLGPGGEGHRLVVAGQGDVDDGPEQAVLVPRSRCRRCPARPPPMQRSR